MELSDLFVSYKQVDPVQFDFVEPEMPDDIYANLERAKSVAAETPAATPVPPVTPPASPGATTTVATPEPKKRTDYTSPADDSSDGSKPTRKKIKVTPERAKYWMDKFTKFGVNEKQNIAIVSAMMTECGLNPVGAVEKKELAGQGNTKKGWAHAGEGAVGFTHWSLKKKLIEKYNNHPDRQGPTLSTDEAEYAKSSSRHIADLSEDDHALLAYLFYQPLLEKTAGETDFNNVMAEFYMEKAGRGFGQRPGAGTTPYEKAVYTGKVYQRSHEKMGYHKAAKVNGFIKALNYAKDLGEQLGYSV